MEIVTLLLLSLSLFFRGDKMFFSDFVTNQILRANLDGTNTQELLNDAVEIPGQDTALSSTAVPGNA